MKEAQVEQQLELETSLACKSVPICPHCHHKCSHKTWKLARQERNSSTCHARIPAPRDIQWLENPLSLKKDGTAALPTHSGHHAVTFTSYSFLVGFCHGPHPSIVLGLVLQAGDGVEDHKTAGG